MKKELIEISKEYKLKLHAKEDFKDRNRKKGAEKFSKLCFAKMEIEPSVTFLTAPRTTDEQALIWIFESVGILNIENQRHFLLKHDPHSWSKSASRFIAEKLKPYGWNVMPIEKGNKEIWLGVVDYLLYGQKN